LVDLLGLGDAVTLTGPVAPPVLAAHYCHADVFVCLSEHEGFCVPLVEAMHHGVPVVAQASSAIPETVQRAGIVLAWPGATAPSLATVAAAVHRAVSDSVVADRLRAAGHRRAAELALAPTRARYRAALRAVWAR
jgi:glycosyltransferase involved in cell wall biosynthesis